MQTKLNRRDFFKLGGLALAGLAFRPYFPTEGEQDYGDLARICVREIDLRAEPRDGAEIVGKRYRDQLVQIYYELEPPDAPAFYNKRWYRVWGGYLHSTYIQRVQVRLNEPLGEVPAAGWLGEVTVPYTQSYSFSRLEGWQVDYRLYYETTHWLTGIDEGPDGTPWYRITDELQPIDYFVPAAHVRLVTDEEVAPISPEVPQSDKRIEVDLALQTLMAYEGDELVRQARVSTGVSRTVPPENGIPTETPKGRFNIYSKMPSKHMGDGRLMRGDLDLEAYELVGVPWTMFFHSLMTGYALHGTYWHDNFGVPMSHGCINLRNEDAKWLFRWADPQNSPQEIEKTGHGTPVHVY
jgi:lipoprotein-anchoring transpeptidase ErfK/SrfK